jgi:hypothetical protein
MSACGDPCQRADILSQIERKPNAALTANTVSTGNFPEGSQGRARQQVFLLERFIVEAGYSGAGVASMPQPVREAVSLKHEQIKRADYGYVTMAIEQIHGFAEGATGMLWPTATIKGSKTRF